MTAARTLVTTGRAAEILGITRWGIRYLVAERILEPWRAWELQGVGKSTQHLFRLEDVVALLTRRSLRVHAEQLEERRRRTLKPKTHGTQLAFFWPPAKSKLLPWIPKPRPAWMGRESLRQRLVREGKQAGRLKVAGRRR